MTYICTYSPDDNKLRLYANTRLPAEDYDRVKKAGFRWAPKQDLFFAHWSPRAEDIALAFAGEIDDEDTSLLDRAEERADRFEDYQDKRTREAAAAKAAVDRIADGIPFGQPILVGHHSERHARKDAERIENGMRKAIRLWDTANYWKDRARGAIRHAKYLERPDVRARRIKTIEADLRKQQRAKAEAETFLRAWSIPHLTQEQALKIANYCSLHLPRKEGDRPDFQHTPTAYDVLTNHYPNLYAPRTLEEVVAAAQEAYPKAIARAQRWITHYENRLAYERAMLGAQGGTVVDKTGPEKGGAVRCWAAPGFGQGWAYIQKVNKVSVTIHTKPNYGDRTLRTVMAFDQLKAIMTKAEVDAARDAGRLKDAEGGTGFFLLDTASEPEIKIAPTLANGMDLAEAAEIARMRESRRAGIKVEAVPQLFPTPPELAERVIEMADIQPGHRVLEPSAGTGALLRALDEARGYVPNYEPPMEIVGVELNADLVRALPERLYGSMLCGDFLECNRSFGSFDRIVMNPPFAEGQDVKHVTHALKFLKPGGRLVAIMSAGVTFRSDRATKALRQIIAARGTIEELPADSFKPSGTNVRTVLVTINA